MTLSLFNATMAAGLLVALRPVQTKPNDDLNRVKMKNKLLQSTLLVLFALTARNKCIGQAVAEISANQGTGLTYASNIPAAPASLSTASTVATPSDTSALVQSVDRGGVGKGAWNFEMWGSGASGLYGRNSDTVFSSVGVRVGKILTETHGTGWRRGSLEYAFDLVPAYRISDKHRTTYGGGFNPIVLIWNFTSRRTLVPFAELVGGGIFTTREIPTGASFFNFTAQAGVGTHYFLSRRQAATLSVRYFHISNATLGTINPGINGIHLVMGYEWFK